MSFIDRGGTLDLAARLRARRSRVQIPLATRVFFFLSKTPRRALGPSSPHRMVTVVFCRG